MTAATITLHDFQRAVANASEAKGDDAQLICLEKLTGTIKALKERHRFTSAESAMSKEQLTAFLKRGDWVDRFVTRRTQWRTIVGILQVVTATFDLILALEADWDAECYRFASDVFEIWKPLLDVSFSGYPYQVRLEVVHVLLRILNWTTVHTEKEMRKQKGLVSLDFFRTCFVACNDENATVRVLGVELLHQILLEGYNNAGMPNDTFFAVLMARSVDVSARVRSAASRSLQDLDAAFILKTDDFVEKFSDRIETLLHNSTSAETKDPQYALFSEDNFYSTLISTLLQISGEDPQKVLLNAPISRVTRALSWMARLADLAKKAKFEYIGSNNIHAGIRRVCGLIGQALGTLLLLSGVTLSVIEQIKDVSQDHRASILEILALVCEVQSNARKGSSCEELQDVDNPSPDQILASIKATCTHLRVPGIFATNQLLDEAHRRKAEIFNRTAVAGLKIISNIVTGCNLQRIYFEQKVVSQLVMCCAALSVDESWTDPTLRSLANDLLQILPNLDSKKPSAFPIFLMNHSQYILDQELRPFFALHPAVANQIALQKRVRHVAAPKNGGLPRGVDQEGFYDSQSWKTDRVEIPSVLEWCVKTFKHPDLNNVVSLITPPTLTLLDDYDPYFKIRGIRLLSYIVSHVDPTLARRNGLGDVFFEALMTCLTYTTASSTEEPLFSAAVPCILSVADTIEIRGTLEYRQRFERILEKGILPAMASGGDRIAVRSVLMDGFPKVIGGIGMEVVRHLRVLVPLFCDTLELSILYPPRRDAQSSTSHLQPYTIQLSATAALEKLVTVAWMRIPNYSGRILKAIATAWYRAKRDEVDASREGDRTELARRNKIPVSEPRNALLEKLQNLCTLLLKCCGNIAKADMEALEQFDANMFQGLLSTSR